MTGSDATLRRCAVVLACALGWAAAAGCSGPKQIEHYQPDVVANQVEKARQTAPNVVLAVQDFSTDSAYDEKRIVYRHGKYKFNYYHFHRWAAPPGMLVSDALRKIYRRTGAFDAVVGGYSSRADVVLMGRVTAIEEIDVSKEKWIGRIALDLELRDAVTGELLWNDTFIEERKLSEQSPAGLAAAVSRALADIGSKTAPKLAQLGERQVEQRPTTQESEESKGMFDSSGGEDSSEKSKER